LFDQRNARFHRDPHRARDSAHLADVVTTRGAQFFTARHRPTRKLAAPSAMLQARRTALIRIAQRPPGLHAERPWMRTAGLSGSVRHLNNERKRFAFRVDAGDDQPWPAALRPSLQARRRSRPRSAVRFARLPLPRSAQLNGDALRDGLHHRLSIRHAPSAA
jgi:hypothetical protein